MLRWLRKILQPETVEVEITGTLHPMEFTPPPQLPPITLVSPACPYCGVIQNPPPQRRKKCRDCGQVIHPWTDRDIRIKYLLTAAEHKLEKRRERDTKWSDLNNSVLDGLKSGDWHKVMFAYFQQAGMLFDEKRDYQSLASESRKAELRYHQNMGATKVENFSCYGTWQYGELHRVPTNAQAAV